MESEAITRRRVTTVNARLDENRNPQQPLCSRSRDLPPLIRRDFVTSPWKRFRPSTHDVDQPSGRRRPAGNIHDCPVTDATEPSASMQRRQPRSRARCPGFTSNPVVASCGYERRPRLSSHVASSMNFRDFQVNRVDERFHRLNQHVDGPSRCPRFTDKADSRLDLARSTGKHFLLFYGQCYFQ